MPITHTVDTASGLATLVHSDDGTFEEWREATLACLNHPGFRPGFQFFSDRRCCAEAPPREFVDQMIEFSKSEPRLRGVRWAIVVSPSVAARYAMSPMWSMMLEDALGFRTEFFTSLGEGLAWLGQP
jgi:hypothetical protein